MKRILFFVWRHRDTEFQYLGQYLIDLFLNKIITPNGLNYMNNYVNYLDEFLNSKRIVPNSQFPVTNFTLINGKDTYFDTSTNKEIPIDKNFYEENFHLFKNHTPIYEFIQTYNKFKEIAINEKRYFVLCNTEFGTFYKEYKSV